MSMLVKISLLYSYISCVEGFIDPEYVTLGIYMFHPIFDVTREKHVSHDMRLQIHFVK